MPLCEWKLCRHLQGWLLAGLNQYFSQTGFNILICFFRNYKMIILQYWIFTSEIDIIEWDWKKFKPYLFTNNGYCQLLMLCCHCLPCVSPFHKNLRSHILVPSPYLPGLQAAELGLSIFLSASRRALGEVNEWIMMREGESWDNLLKSIKYAQCCQRRCRFERGIWASLHLLTGLHSHY